MLATRKKIALKRLKIFLVLFCFLIVQFSGIALLYAKPAKAQLVVTDPVTGAQTTVKNIKDFLKIVVVNGGMMAMLNAASQFTQKIAYDLAVSLASGGGGEMPLFSTEGWGDYFENAALDAAGEFIGSFGESLGVDFCAPPNPQIGLNIQLGLASVYGEEGPTPRCEWSDIQSNWENFISEVQTEEFLSQMASQFRVSYGEGSNDVDLAISGFIGAFGVEESATKEAELTREEGQGFLPSTELIGGQIKTPAEMIRQTAEQTTQGPAEAENTKSISSSQALASGAEGILMQFVQTFLNTLLSKTMDRLFSDGFYSLADLFPGGGGVSDEEEAVFGGRKAAELAFADFLTPNIKEGGAVDILTQFVVCPEKYRSQNNCVLDGKFEAAVRQAQAGTPLTVAQAIEKDFLDPDRQLIPPSDTAKNQDPYCYTYGYCYSNLTKMRKARIIPIGWEIAAMSGTSDRPVSLGEVISKFYDCNALGKADSEHPYCHLIDPNWILKAPAEQCRAKVYGPVLQTAENSFRQEACVDSPTCIAEDDNGNCEGGWGYCLREKNIWRLNGDKCDAQYDTCKALKRSDGQTVAYLTNTVDYGPPCTSEDVGCRWYSARQTKAGGDWQWQDVLSGAGADARRTDRIFFNKNIEQCDEPGCNEFLRTTKATKLNYVANSSFENFEGTPNDGAGDVFGEWVQGDVAPNNLPEAVSDTYFGQTALKIPSSGSNILKFIETEKPVGGKKFILSFYVKSASATQVCAKESLLVASGSIDRIMAEPFVGWRGANGRFPDEDASSSSWSRYQISYEPPSSETNTVFAFRFYLGANCLIDAVQLEEGAITAYHEGWNGAGEALYLKSAPDHYACYDYNSDGSLNKTNDADLCKDFSKACEEKDVGCEKFTPANGDPWIPGVASYPDDYCPKECVGYQTFKQVSTDFEQEKFPVYFIPATARTCSAADAGCDQFTSLEDEAVASFSAIRRCEKPGAATSATFYTWEGSDTSGYQLKNWNLKISNLNEIIIDRSPAGGVGPCTRLDPADSTRCADDRSAGTCTKADLAANPDCREFYDSAGNKHYRLYSKTIIATDDCHPYRKTISNSADCGISGGKWDGAKNECTYQVYLPETRVCSAASVGCRAYRGNAGANVSIILNDNFDDGTTSGWSSGSSSSESLTVGGKSLAVSTAAGTTASKSLAGTVRKGGIYTLSFWAKGDSRLDIKFSGASASSDKVFSSATVSPVNLSFEWRYFSLGPVYVTSDDLATLRITPSGGTMANIYIDNIVLREVQDYIYLVKNSWATPDSCDRTFFMDSTVTNSANCSAIGGSWNAETNECIVSGALPQAQLGCALYRDRSNRDHYLKSFTRLCSPDAAGCEKLIKTWNNDETGIAEFNKENDSEPSLSPEERLSDNIKIPADDFAFLIVDDAYKCKPENASCADFGSPKLDASGNVKIEGGKPQYDTVSLLADPAKFTGDTGKIICQVQYQGCEEYATTEGGSLYFKDPGARTCEWKNNITFGGRSVSGWFKKGSEPAEPCDPFAFYGGTYNIWKNGDTRCVLPNICNTAGGCSCSVPAGGGTPGVTPTGIAGSSCTVSYGKRTCPYSGWVGECPTAANMCTKFIDPADISTESPGGQSYYYIKNDKLSPGDCNGTASRRDGCVLLNDTSIAQANYSAVATYVNSEAKVGDPGGRVAPVDCSKTPRDPGCRRCLNIKARSVCTGLPLFPGGPRGAPCFDYTDYHYGSQCQKDSECSGDYAESDPAEAGKDGESCRTIIPSPTVVTTKIIFDTEPKNVNDSNILLKVRRDRVCGEWLDCAGANSTFDSQTGRQKMLCEQLGVCNAYSKAGEATQCIDWNDEPETYRKVLTKDLYASRDTSWQGMEYSGDSIYNQYQAVDLQGVNIGTEDNPKNVLAFIDDRCFNSAGAPADCGVNPEGTCASDVNGSRCGEWGKCYNHLCVTNFRGDPVSPGDLLFVDNNPETASCRAYPEQSSPFPTTVVAKWGPDPTTGTDLISKKPGFSGANVCERQFAKVCVGGPKEGSFCVADPDCRESGGTDGVCTEKELTNTCECGYKKVSYGNGAVLKYFSAETGVGLSIGPTIPSVCVGGPNQGKRCTEATVLTDCGAVEKGGQCVSAQREDTVQGWQGYCLERDTSTSINGDPGSFACLTWYPIDQLPGVADIYNQYVEAGYQANGKNYYCLQAEPYKNIAVNRSGYMCFDADEPGECDPGDRGYCRDQISCPSGYVAIIGACEEWGWGSGHWQCVGDVWDDCPYKCVPLNSYHSGSGNVKKDGTVLFSWNANQPCFPVGTNFTYTGGDTTRPKLTSWTDSDSLTSPDNNYNRPESADTDKHDQRYEDCVRPGAPYGVADTGTTDEEYFAGCQYVAKIVDSDGIDNKAWTDRLWASGVSEYTLKTGAGGEMLRYGQSTAVNPFGTVAINPIGDPPENVKLPVCREGSDFPEKWGWTLPNVDLTCPTETPEQVPPFTNEGRPYSLFSTEKAGVAGTEIVCNFNDDCNPDDVRCAETSFSCRRTCNNNGDCGSGGSCEQTVNSNSIQKYCSAGSNMNLTGVLTRGGCATREDEGSWLGTCSGGAWAGSQCESDNNCFSRICGIFGFCHERGSMAPSRGTFERVNKENIDMGLGRLQQIFAKVYEILKWKDVPADNPFGPGRYEHQEDFFTGARKEDVSNVGEVGNVSIPPGSSSERTIEPQILALGECFGDKCRQGISDSVTINGIDGDGRWPTGIGTEPENVVGYGGKLKATMRFFGYADKNAMPIRSVATDWGDGSDNTPREGRYKNHLGLKDDNSTHCDGENFGYTADACTDAYFMFTHTYSCPKDGGGLPSCDAVPGRVGCYEASCREDVNGAADGNGSCCVFKPKVQIKDNWGWCNGSCGGTGGCYHGDSSNQCDTIYPGGTHLDWNPWTSFAGQVIVVPK